MTQRLARWERLRQWLLLVLRTLAIAALVFALARPVESTQISGADGQGHVAFVVDTSASMDLVLDGESLFERAVSSVEDKIQRLYPGQLGTLVWAGRDAKAALPVPTDDRGQLREALGRGEVEAGGSSLAAAISLAQRQFEGAELPLRVVVLSDFSRGGDVFDLDLQESGPVTVIEWFDVAERDEWKALNNVALSGLEIERVPGNPDERILRVEVWNSGPAPIENLEVGVMVNGLNIQQSILVNVEPGRRTSKSLTLRFDAPGRHEGELFVEASPNNGLKLDDRLPFIVEVNEAFPILVVDGEPSSRQLDGEADLFLRALEVLPDGVSPFDTTIRTLDDIAGVRPDLDDYRVVVLANVAELPANWIDALEGFVEQGGGLMWSLGSQIDFEVLNESALPLLAVPLRDFYRAEDRVSGTPALLLQDVATAHPALGGLGDRFVGSLRASRTRGYFNIAVDASKKTRLDTLLRLENGAPLLVTRRFGNGRLALWLTSLDLALTDLPVASAFPALSQRLVRYLANQNYDAKTQVTRLGARKKQILPSQADAIAWVTPSGERREWLLELGQLEHSSVIEGEELGVYRVEVKREGRWSPRPDLAFAVASHLFESDYTPIPRSLLESEIEETVNVSSDAGGEERGENQWASIFLLSLSAIFVTEAMLAARG